MRRTGIVTRSFATTAPRLPVGPGVATSRPTPEFLARHVVTAPQVDQQAFRPGWLVQSRLDGLLAAGKIDREAHEVARQWRHWAELIGVQHVQRWDVRVDAAVHPRDAVMLRRIEAAAKLRDSLGALGELRVRLLECCLVRDLSWREIALRARLSDKTAQGRVVEAIEALADWQAGRPVAPPPELSYRRNGIGAG